MTVEFTQCGQPGPYQDTIFAGTVTAVGEQDAREQILRAVGYPRIFDRQDSDEWHVPYYRSFQQVGETAWKFHVVRAYTG